MNQDPDYIAERLFPDFVRKAAGRQDISIASYSDDWVHVLTRGGMIRYINGYRFDLNHSAAAQNANDKVAAYRLLHAGGASAVQHVLLGVTPGEFPVVVKPLHGTGGRDIVLLRSRDEYERWQTADNHKGRWAVSPLESITREIRVIMLDGTPLVVYEKTDPRRIMDGFFAHNLGQGALPRLLEDVKAVELARHAMQCLGLRVASVDVVVTPQGYKILEVNDGIMMEYFARHSEEYRQIAENVYAQIVVAMFEAKNSTHAIL